MSIPFAAIQQSANRVRILPTLALLFLCSFLDRTNVGNAKIIGLETNININDQQYDIGLMVYYLFYICSELPSNLVLKKASPKLWLPFLTVLWGIITMCLGFVRNYGGFVAVRAILGIAEGGLLPGMVCHLEPSELVCLTINRFCTCRHFINGVTWLYALVCSIQRLLCLALLVVSTPPCLHR